MHSLALYRRVRRAAQLVRQGDDIGALGAEAQRHNLAICYHARPFVLGDRRSVGLRVSADHLGQACSGLVGSLREGKIEPVARGFAFLAQLGKQLGALLQQ